MSSGSTLPSQEVQVVQAMQLSAQSSKEVHKLVHEVLKVQKALNGLFTSPTRGLQDEGAHLIQAQVENAISSS